MTLFLDASDADFGARFSAFARAPRGGIDDAITATAADIVADVRRRGGEAVAEYTWEFDRLRVDPDSLASDSVQLEELAEQCPSHVRDALDFAEQRVRAFHERQRPADLLFEDGEGLELGWRWQAVASAALYVPGGRASYPSSVIMNAVPARIAGVERVVMVAPAPHGKLSPALAYAALRADVREFHPIGGAQAIAALAYGAGRLAPVDKIVGPGNAYVAAAKRLVFGHVGIDSVAGPSEVCIVADADNDPRWIAADLLAQAEHDPDAQSVLITSEAEFGHAVGKAVAAALPGLETRAVAAQSWERHGAVIVAPLDRAAELANELAPEHLQIATADPDAIAADIRRAGALFLGRYAPEVLGDYVSGPNHVLPTSGTARFASGLSVEDFCTRTTIQRIDISACHRLAGPAVALAEAEGLAAHALSARLRLEESR